MFLEVAHVQIFFVASFDLTDVLLPSVFVLEVNLNVLFEVGGGGERFAAAVADERFFFGVDPAMAVQV